MRCASRVARGCLIVPLLTLAIALVAVDAVAAQRIPSFPRNEPYARARNTLLALGWRPVTMPGADACMDGDARCRGRPEMEACAGTGLANCLFTWRKDQSLIAVSTIGEQEPVVVGVQCRAGCR